YLPEHTRARIRSYFIEKPAPFASWPGATHYVVACDSCSDTMLLSPHHSFRCDRSSIRKLVALVLLLSTALASAQERSLELSRTVRPSDFLTSIGTRGGLLGDECGKMDAWVSPLKLFRNFRVQFDVGGRILPADALARTVTTRPESSSILSAGDTFTVKETFFVPVQE